MTEQPGPKRGRETAADMVRSLGLVLAGVLAIWYLAQPPDSDSQELRVVSPDADVAAFTADEPQAAVPGELPERWRPTSTQLTDEPRRLRIGYVTPSDQYAEYAASTAPRADAVAELTGRRERLEPVTVDGVEWEQYRDRDGSLSLVRAYGPVTVVIGTLRSTAPLAELEVLARGLV